MPNIHGSRVSIQVSRVSLNGSRIVSGCASIAPRLGSNALTIGDIIFLLNYDEQYY
jgi:hypothetical protein